MNWEITPVSTATAVGLYCATSFCASAGTIALSAMPILIMPPVKTSQTSSKAGPNPSHLARQWRAVYDNGKVYGPILSTTAALSWLYVASVLPAGKLRARNLYIAGALICLSTIPYTGVVMLNTITELSNRASAAERGQQTEEEKETQSTPTTSTAALIKRWAHMHTGRGIIPLFGIACVIIANL